MEKISIFVSILLFSAIYTNSVFGTIEISDEVIVSCSWLEENMVLKNMVIIDIRSPGAYNSGHIKGSINLPFETNHEVGFPVSPWVTMKNDLILEAPDFTELASFLSENGITKSSQIAIVTNAFNPDTQPPYSIANAVRTAFTLKYAGVESVAVLDGGYEKWVSDGKEISLEIPEIESSVFDGEARIDMFASKDDVVEATTNSTIIIDGRDSNIYLGKEVDVFSGTYGHIPSAENIPVASFWNSDSTYIDLEQIKNEVIGIVGTDMNQEVIVYCSVGGYGSVLQFILSELFNYKNVKLYDGSSQEWAMYYDMEI